MPQGACAHIFELGYIAELNGTAGDGNYMESQSCTSDLSRLEVRNGSEAPLRLNVTKENVRNVRTYTSGLPNKLDSFLEAVLM